jgi:hypothetical protein
MTLFLSSTYGLIIYKLCHVWTVNLWINSVVINIVRYKLCDVVKNVTYTFCDLSQINFITYKFCNYKLWKCKLRYWAAFICLQSATLCILRWSWACSCTIQRPPFGFITHYLSYTTKTQYTVSGSNCCVRNWHFLL